MNAIVDLFAGCGGLSLGFQNAGFTVKAGFEYWDVAVTCYGKTLITLLLRLIYQI